VKQTPRHRRPRARYRGGRRHLAPAGLLGEVGKLTRPYLRITLILIVGAAAFGTAVAAVGAHALRATDLSSNTSNTASLAVSGLHRTHRLCLDDNGNSSADGARVQVWHCNSKDAAQNWSVNPDGTIAINGKCMDVVADDNHVDLQGCDGEASQRWTVANGAIVSTESGECLNVPAWGARPRTQLDIRPCHGRASQRWTFPGPGAQISPGPGAQTSPAPGTRRSPGTGTQTSPGTPTSPAPRPTRLAPHPSSSAPRPASPAPGPTSAAPGTSLKPDGVPGNWAMAFDDEFNGTSVNTSKWAIGDGGTVNDVTTSPSNVSESGGDLNLQLSNSSTGAVVCSGGTNTPCGGSTPDGYALPVGGFAEARIWFPGSGSSIDNWPAWWVSGANWPAAGEADIAEGLGDLTVNYHSPSGAHNDGAVTGTWSSGWHVYGIWRHATSDDVYWDGTLVKSFPTDDNGQPEALILNVGSGNTAVYGAASDVKVDYVRVWAPAGP
jgi:hypothetical protein